MSHTLSLGTDEIAYMLETGEYNDAIDKALEQAAIECEETKTPVTLTITVNFVAEDEVKTEDEDEESGEE